MAQMDDELIGPAMVASQRVADSLAMRILSGELPPGTRIKQDELASELQTSRIPVRDALRILESRGLVTLKANSGARVATLTLRDMEISYEIREKLEPMLLAESMPHLTEGDLDKMRVAKAKLEAVRDVADYLPLSRDFHWTAFSRGQSILLERIVGRLWDVTHSYRLAYAKLALQDAARMRIMCDERDLLFGAIERGELDLAPRILALHIRRTHLVLRDFGDLTIVMGAGG
jgi:DNA-binding GntR family transcriptional regulator